MKSCDTCANMKKGTCRTMMKTPKELFCYMTIQQAIDAERDIINYALATDRTDNSVNSVLRASSRIIKGFENEIHNIPE